MNSSNTNRIVKRLEAAEKKLASTLEKKFVFRDFDGSYFGDCGSNISREQLVAWLERQEPAAHITIIKYLAEVPRVGGT